MFLPRPQKCWFLYEWSFKRPFAEFVTKSLDYWSIGVTFQRIVETNQDMLTSRGHHGVYRTHSHQTLRKNIFRNLKMCITRLVSRLMSKKQPKFKHFSDFPCCSNAKANPKTGDAMVKNVETNMFICIFRSRDLFFIKVRGKLVL